MLQFDEDKKVQLEGHYELQFERKEGVEAEEDDKVDKVEVETDKEVQVGKDEGRQSERDEVVHFENIEEAQLELDGEVQPEMEEVQSEKEGS